MEMHEIEVWVCLDESGDYAIGKDQDEAAEAFVNDIGGDSATRHVCVKLKVPAPKPVEVVAELPEEADGCEVTVK